MIRDRCQALIGLMALTHGVVAGPAGEGAGLGEDVGGPCTGGTRCSCRLPHEHRADQTDDGGAAGKMSATPPAGAFSRISHTVGTPLVIHHYLAVTAVPPDLHHHVVCRIPGDGVNSSPVAITVPGRRGPLPADRQGRRGWRSDDSPPARHPGRTGQYARPCPGAVVCGGGGYLALPDRLRDRRGAGHGGRNRRRAAQPADRELVGRARVRIRLRADDARHAARCRGPAGGAAHRAGRRHRLDRGDGTGRQRGHPGRARCHRCRAGRRFVLGLAGLLAGCRVPGDHRRSTGG